MKHAVITLKSMMVQDDDSLQEVSMTVSGWIECHPEAPGQSVIWGNPDREGKALALPDSDLISVTPIPAARAYE